MHMTALTSPCRNAAAQARRPRTLLGTLVRSSLRAVFITLTVTAAYLAVSTLSPASFPAPMMPGTVEVDTPSEKDQAVARLLRQHRCWSGSAPSDLVGVLPNHAVVTLPNGTTVYAGRVLTGRALDQEILGTYLGLDVAAFCHDPVER